jgi:Fic family protein
MKPLPNFDFTVLDTYPKSLAAIEQHIRLLMKLVEETPNRLPMLIKNS